MEAEPAPAPQPAPGRREESHRCAAERCEQRVKAGGFRFECPSCGACPLCAAHRLQEDHACPGLEHRRQRLRDELGARLIAEKGACAEHEHARRRPRV